MTQYSSDDQWRSFQTFVAAYIAGMRHPRGVFTIFRRDKVAPPLVEFRYDSVGGQWFSIGDLAWSDEDGSSVPITREDANHVALKTGELLRGLDGVDDPGALRWGGSGPASAVSVLASGGFLSFSQPEDVHPARRAALDARMTANIDVDGDVIEAAAREVGNRVFTETKNGSIAAIAAAAANVGRSIHPDARDGIHGGWPAGGFEGLTAFHARSGADSRFESDRGQPSQRHRQAALVVGLPD